MSRSSPKAAWLRARRAARIGIPKARSRHGFDEGPGAPEDADPFGLAHPAADQPEAVVLAYLDRYHDQLFGHPIARDAAGRAVAVVARTNNPAEQFFSQAKRKLRRRLGRAHLGRDMQDHPAQAALTAQSTRSAFGGNRVRRTRRTASRIRRTGASGRGRGPARSGPPPDQCGPAPTHPGVGTRARQRSQRLLATLGQAPLKPLKRSHTRPNSDAIESKAGCSGSTRRERGNQPNSTTTGWKPVGCSYD